jgi:hypothetical protein
VCACVRACVRACVHARVCVCAYSVHLRIVEYMSPSSKTSDKNLGDLTKGRGGRARASIGRARFRPQSMHRDGSRRRLLLPCGMLMPGLNRRFQIQAAAWLRPGRSWRRLGHRGCCFQWQAPAAPAGISSGPAQTANSHEAAKGASAPYKAPPSRPGCASTLRKITEVPRLAARA